MRDTLDLTPEQARFVGSVREFVLETLSPAVRANSGDWTVPPGVVAEGARRGLFVVTVPSAYGGLGLGQVERMAVLEEVSRASLAAAILVHTTSTALEAVVRFGSEDQKASLLSGLRDGRLLATFALTGDEVSGLPSASFLARPSPGGYVLDGRAALVPHAHSANLVVIVARTGGNELSGFVVRQGAPGFRTGPAERRAGLRACEAADIVLDGCRVDRDALIGYAGQGGEMLDILSSRVGRLGLAGCALGVVRSCLDLALEFSKERDLYGSPLGALRTVQNRLADMYIGLESGRLLAHRAATLLDAGRRCTTEVALAHFVATEAALAAAKALSDLHAGFGTVMRPEPQRLYADSAALSLQAGTPEELKADLVRAVIS